MQIFPYILYRIGGLAYDQLAELTAPDPVLLAEILMLQNQLKAHKTRLNQQLTDFARQQHDYTLKQLVIHLRRDIFNDRNFSARSLQKYLAYPEVQDTLDVINAYRVLLEKVTDLEDRWASAYDRTKLLERRQLQQLAAQPAFQQGILLSSRSFLQRLQAYLTKSPESFRKKERQTERSLLQYLSRAAAKCSPFSSFGLLGSWPSESRELPLSRIWLNNHILAHWMELVAAYPPFFQQFAIELNPSIYRSNDEFVFLVNSRNIESVQRIKADEVVACLYRLMQQSSFVFKELIDAALQAIDTTAEDLEAFVRQLIGYGFLQWQWPVSGSDASWIHAFQNMLKSMERDDLLDDLLGLADRLEEMAALYPTKGLIERKAMLDEMANQLHHFSRQFLSQLAEIDQGRHSNDGAFKKFQPQPFQLRTEQLVFEDCTTSLHQPFTIDQLQPLLESIQKALPLVVPLYGTSLMRQLSGFYALQFAKREEVPLLEFYEQYYQWTHERESEKDEALERLQLNWLDFMASRVDADDTSVYLKVSDLEQAYAALSFAAAGSAEKPGAMACLLQPFMAEGQMRAYLDACFQGYGRMWSRFFPLFPDQITQAQRQWNQPPGRQLLWAENRDASFFNANIHPALMDYEIGIPGGQHDLSLEQRLPIGQLVVRPDRKTNRLLLVDKKSEMQIRVFDLGLEGTLGRSPMYRLLMAFGLPFTQLHAISSLLSRKFGRQEEGIIYQPRIVLDQHLILQRQSWYVPLDQLPVPQPGESEAGFYIRLQQWRRDLNLSDQVFVTVNPPNINREDAKDFQNAPPPPSDDYKPQYIDFSSPAMTKLWIHLITKVPSYMKIEEMLPAPKSLYSFDNQRLVMECVLQWK